MIFDRRGNETVSLDHEDPNVLDMTYDQGMIFHTFDKYEDFHRYVHASVLSDRFLIRSSLHNNHKEMVVPIIIIKKSIL